MAVLYAKAAGGNWSAAGTWSATSSLGVDNAGPPVASTDVIFEAGSGNVTIDATAVCRSLDCTSGTGGYTGTITHTALITLSIGDGTAGAGNVALKFKTGMTYSFGGNSNVFFVSTATTQQTITSAGQKLPNVQFNGLGGSWLCSDSMSCGTTGSLTFAAGTVDYNGGTGIWGTIQRTGSATVNLTLGAANLTLTGTGAWTFSGTTGLTFSGASATITISGSGSFSGGGLTYGTLNMTGAGIPTVTGTNTFTNFNRTGTAVKTDGVSFINNQTITGTLTLVGNSVTNRLLVQSSVVGTARTLTSAANAISNADFMDTTGAGAASWNLAAITGNSGDCQGNSGITFTTPASQTHTASAGGNWSDVTKWTSRVPLPQDNVTVDVNTTGTLTADMPRMGANVDFTGFTGTSTNSISITCFGNFTLASGMTFTGGGATSVTFAGRGSQTLTSAGKTFAQAPSFNCPNGTYTLQDNLNVPSNQSSVAGGTLTLNGFNVTTTVFTISGTSTLNMGSGTFTLTSTVNGGSGGIWVVSAGTITINASTSTILLSVASSSTRTFVGGGKTYNNLTYTVASSPGSLTVTGANTFNNVTIGSGRILTMPSSTTNTLNSTGSFNATGVNNGYLYLPGVAVNYASTPDSAALSITGDIDIRVNVAMDSWTPAALMELLSKYQGSGNQISYLLRLNTNGTLVLFWSNDGSTLLSATSTVSTGLAAGSLKWVRATLAVNNGASGNTVKFYTSDDNITQTQLGSTVTQAGTTSIFDSTTPVEVGSRGGGTSPSAGKFYRAQVYNGIAGTLTFDANFTTKTFGANTFTESSTNAATVTINGSLAQVGDGRVSLVSSTPGTAATLSMGSSGTVSCGYLSIQDSTATGGASWKAGPNSINVSGNTGWTFGITASASGGAWNTNGAWVGSVQPTATDDVYLASTSGSVNIPASTTALCQSLSCLAYTNTLTFAATTSVLTIGSASGGACTFVNTMTLTLTGIGTINFVATTASTTYQLTTGGRTLPNVTISTGSTTTIKLADSCTLGSAALMNLNTGKLDTNSQACSWGGFQSDNTVARTITLGTTTLTITGAAAQGWTWLTSPSTLLTVSAASSTINCTASGNFHTGSGGFTFGSVTLTTTAHVLAGSNTFTNLTINGSASKTATLSLNNGSSTITGTLTITGNSVTNRVFINTVTIGTAQTFTAAAVSITNADFMDITGAGAASPFTGTSLGDCLGNSNITFDTPVTQTHTASAGGNWSDVTKWTSRVPLPQDNVTINVNTTGTLTCDMPRMGANIDFTGFVGTATLNTAGTNYSFFGNWTMATGMTYTQGGTFIPSGRSSQTLTTGGKTLGVVTVQAPGGTYTLQDAYTASGRFTLSFGTWTTNNNNMTVTYASACYVSLAGTTLNFGTTTWTASNGGTNPVSLQSSVGNISAASSTLIITGASAVTRQFIWPTGTTIGTVTYTVANSPGELTFNQSQTFGTFNVGSGRVLTMVSSTTTTITNAFNVSGVNNGYLYLPGVSGSYVSAPDSAALSITGDIDLRAKVAIDNYVTSTSGSGADVLIAKDGAVGTRSYIFRLFTAASPTLQLILSPDGTSASQVSANSSAGFSISAGGTIWLRATWSQSGKIATFYTSNDGSTWTQLGTTVALNVASIFDSTAALELSTRSVGAADYWSGNFYRAQIRNNILDNGTGIVFDSDFTTKVFGVNSFTESSSNAATVTINGTLAQAGDGRVVLNSSTPGTKATLSKSSGIVSADYLTIQDSAASGGATWYAGGNSVNISNNTGWNFRSTTKPDGFFELFD